MSKRKSSNPADDGSDTEMRSPSPAPSDDSSPDIVNVDFEFFDPQPQDFHGLRTLIRQLLSADSTMVNISSLVDLILSQPTIGSTVKTEGHEGDPFGFLTVLNANEHVNNNEGMKGLLEYLVKKSKGGVRKALTQCLSRSAEERAAEGDLGIVLHERLLGVPAELTPPMVKMMLEECQWAVEDKEPFKFSHYLILTKVYTEIPSKLDGDEQPAKKRQQFGLGRNAKGQKGKELMYVHPEMEWVRKLVGEQGSHEFKFTNEGEAADSKRAFSEMGLELSGCLMVVEAAKMPEVLATLEGLFRK